MKHGKKHPMLTRAKAKRMLEEGMARGHKLSKAQKGLFGLIAGGGRPSKGKKGKKSKKKGRKKGKK